MPASALYQFCGMTIASEVPLPHLRRGRGPAQCAIACGNGRTTLGDIAWFHEWRRRRGPLWLSFGRCDGGYLLRFAEHLADFVVSADAARIEARPGDGLPIETLRHLLIDQVLPLVAARQGRLALHASAVHVDGFGTIGFAGDAGRGKSTLAAALAAAGARVVTDDCLALEMQGSTIDAIPGYPGLRLWPRGAGAAVLGNARGTRVAHYSTKRRIADAAFRSSRSPLRALFLLSPRASHGPAAAIRRCGASARLMGLLRYAYVLDVGDRAELTSAFRGLSMVAAAVPVMRLRVRDGRRHLGDAAVLIREFAARP